MRYAISAALLIAGCGTGQPQPSAANTATAEKGAGPRQAGWDLQSGDEGAELLLADASGEPAMRMLCPGGEPKLVVNVPDFEPIGSEERLSFGHGGEVVALVADASGDEARGGVTAEGAVPDNFVALLSGQVSASYGAQVSGPHPVPSANLVKAFAAACSNGSGDPAPGETSGDSASPAGGSACLTGRDGEPVPANAIKAVGTEPFWAATVEGRCVTYSHPENQSGTRVWTEFSGSAENGTWSGFLNERRFVMRTRPQQGCSDGMSDKRYPIAVTLTVNGEQRTGCAEPR